MEGNVSVYQWNSVGRITVEGEGGDLKEVGFRLLTFEFAVFGGFSFTGCGAVLTSFLSLAVDAIC